MYPPFGKQTKSTWDPAVSFCQTHKHQRIPCLPTFTLLALFSYQTTSSTKYSITEILQKISWHYPLLVWPFPIRTFAELFLFIIINVRNARNKRNWTNNRTYLLRSVQGGYKPRMTRFVVPARQAAYRLAESIPGLLKSFKIPSVMHAILYVLMCRYS